MEHLYIIGNGFDKHHWIDSGFDDFGRWLEENHASLFYQLVSIYSISDEKEWQQFEHILGELNVTDQVEGIMEDRRPNWMSLPDDDRSFNNAKRDYEDAPEVARYTFEELFEKVRYTFVEWINQLNEPERKQMITMEKNSTFVTFNYTDTLESLYKIAANQIIYIHGCAKRGEKLELGHGKTVEDIQSEYYSQIPEDVDSPEQIEHFYANANDWVEEDTYMEIIQRLADQRKPVEDLIGKLNKLLLDNMTDIVHIHIYGFSFSDIDMPYIATIANHINRNRVMWEVTYYADDEAMRFCSQLESLGIPKENILLTTLKDLNRYGRVGHIFRNN